jgi:hypothetical protein
VPTENKLPQSSLIGDLRASLARTLLNIRIWHGCGTIARNTTGLQRQVLRAASDHWNVVGARLGDTTDLNIFHFGQFNLYSRNVLMAVHSTIFAMMYLCIWRSLFPNNAASWDAPSCDLTGGTFGDMCRSFAMNSTGKLGK